MFFSLALLVCVNLFFAIPVAFFCLGVADDAFRSLGLFRTPDARMIPVEQQTHKSQNLPLLSSCVLCSCDDLLVVSFIRAASVPRGTCVLGKGRNSLKIRFAIVFPAWQFSEIVVPDVVLLELPRGYLSSCDTLFGR